MCKLYQSVWNKLKNTGSYQQTSQYRGWSLLIVWRFQSQRSSTLHCRCWSIHCHPAAKTDYPHWDVWQTLVLYHKLGCSAHLNVSVDYLILMEVFEPLEDLFGVEDDSGFVVLQGTPFGAQERWQTSYRQECNIAQDDCAVKSYFSHVHEGRDENKTSFPTVSVTPQIFCSVLVLRWAMSR